MALIAKDKSKSFKKVSENVAVKGGSNSARIVALLRSKKGATLPELVEATGWQAHSVRGFLAGALRQKHGLEPISEKRNGELRRYRAR
jgi:hypothetical protein